MPSSNKIRRFHYTELTLVNVRASPSDVITQGTDAALFTVSAKLSSWAACNDPKLDYCSSRRIIFVQFRMTRTTTKTTTTTTTTTAAAATAAGTTAWLGGNKTGRRNMGEC